MKSTKFRNVTVPKAGWCLVLSVIVGSVGCGSEESAQGTTAPVKSVAYTGVPNQIPVVESLDLRPGKPAPGRTVQVNASVTDPEGDATETRYVWQTSTGRILGEGRSFDTHGLRAGDRLQVVVTARDATGESEPVIKKFSLAEPSVEVEFVAIDASRGTSPGSTLSAVVEATKGTSQRYDILYEWVVAGKVVGREKEFDTSPLSPGDIVELRARLDFGDQTSRLVSAKYITLARGEAPRITSEPLAGIEGGIFNYQIRAASAGPGSNLSYELLEGPEGMKVDPKSGLVSWRPGSEQRGAFKIEVAVRDRFGNGNAQSFTISVDAPQSSPASPR